MSKQVIVHAAISLDGATTGFEPDAARFYELARRWSEDVTLTGADTILAQQAALANAPRPGPAKNGPLLAVVDGRRRVSEWTALRECGHWRDVVALRSRAGGDPGVAAPREIVTASDRVDLAEALERLEGEMVRVDSGGTLNGALLSAGLVDEVSLLVHPLIVGADAARRWHGTAPPADLVPISSEQLDGELTWLRYRLRK